MQSYFLGHTLRPTLLHDPLSDASGFTKVAKNEQAANEKGTSVMARKDGKD
jgi:hypothetical protein